MLLAIPNLASSRTVECSPWETTTMAPPRIHWNHPEIEHVFYSGVEGLISSAQIDSKSNPAKRCLLIIQDVHIFFCYFKILSDSFYFSSFRWG